MFTGEKCRAKFWRQKWQTEELIYEKYGYLGYGRNNSEYAGRFERQR